jgi:hypothetical protein
VTYVSGGIESAMAQAKAAAGDKDVQVRGAYTAQRALEAGVLDEVQIHQIPVLLGGGRRLFDVLASHPGDRHACGNSHPLPRPSLNRSTSTFWVVVGRGALPHRINHPSAYGGSPGISTPLIRDHPPATVAF